jgi:SAM-dependent methyltransferase
MQKVRASMASHYEACFSKYGSTIEGASWGNDIDRLHTRWRLLFELLRLDPKGILSSPSMLDVGCSYGGMYGYAKDQGIKICYHGVDIVDKAIFAAKQNYPDANFKLGDFNTLYSSESFDYVIACGIFGIKGDISHRDMHFYWKKTIFNMFDRCKNGIAFNVFTNKVNIFHKEAFYVSPLEALAFCMESISDKVVLHHASGLFDYFIYVYK